MNELGNRKLVILQTQDPTAIANVIGEALVASGAPLFNMEDGLKWVNKGELVEVRMSVLQELISKYVTAHRPVKKPDGSWGREFCPVELDESTLRIMLGTEGKAGSLVDKVAKGPSEPRRLSEQQQREVKDRLRIGEPKDKLARDYNVDVDVIRQLVR